MKKTTDPAKKTKKKRHLRLGLRPYYVLVALCEVLIGAVVALILGFLVEDVLHWRLPVAVWVLVFSVILSCVLGVLLSSLIFGPITRLSRAMRQVGQGNFAAHLEPPNHIREIRDIYDDFNRMTRELGATEIIQTDFVSNVSHEFKTPINAIEGYATLLQDGTQSPEQAMYVDKILLNTRRLSDLVGNILLLSKVDNQSIDSKLTRYRLDEQIRQAIVLLENKWSEKEIDFDVDLSSAEFVGNESMMLHVWVNLIDNAIKYDPYGGMIRLRLQEEEEALVFTIDDTGPGIPEGQKEHIFDKFYQIDSSHTTEGNGLGLALTKRVLDTCGGTITVENLPEAGCRFTVTLPKQS